MEADCSRKLMVINLLFLACVATVGLMYYTDFFIADFKLYDLLK